MQRIAIGMSFLSLLMLGCAAEAPYTDNSQDSEAYAKSVKEMVLSAADGAKQSREPVDAIQPLVDEFKQTDRPVGKYADTYAKMLTVASSIVEEGNKAGGRPPNLGPKLTELVTLANSLPGDVTISRPRGD